MVALLFGASSGIGYATAKLLVKKGYTDLNASRTQAAHSAIFNIACDVTKPGDIEHAVGYVLDSQKKIDVLIYAPGFSMAAPIEFAQEEDYRYLFEVNFFGAIKAIQSVVPAMRETGGRIILISSLGSILPIAFDSFYSASKAALDMLAREANVELNPYNIHVTSFQAGPTATRFTFKRKIYPDSMCGQYAPELNKATSVLAGMEQSGMTAEENAVGIINVLEAKTPPILTSVGWKNKTVSLTQKILPVRMADWINKQQYLQ